MAATTNGDVLDNRNLGMLRVDHIRWPWRVRRDVQAEKRQK